MCRIKSQPSELIEGDQKWIANLDLAVFHADLQQLGKKLEDEQGEADVRHLNKIIFWSNFCAAVGLLTMGFSVNIISIVGLSTFTFTRWTIIAHHTCHGGFDKCHPNKNRFHRFKFAIGSFWRRWCDFFDWMMPEAWNIEHNNRHHYNLSEDDDPDLLERNMKSLREMKVPMIFKYSFVAFLMMTWKWFYYAPNTYKELKLARLRRQGRPIPPGVDPDGPMTIEQLFLGRNPFYSLFEFLTVVIGPYFVLHFLVAPAPYLLLEQYLGMEGLYTNAIMNLALAEVLTNIHAFLAVAPNHVGYDLFRFRHGCRPYSGSFFLRQVTASVDYATGTDLVDFSHGWLNYQIEHHLWPNLSMLSYQKAAPLVREICSKHGVPYIQENVFIRLKKTVDIMVGNTDMKWFPEKYEKLFLEVDAQIEARKHKAK